MAPTTKLRARLEMLGGKEVVAQFGEIKKASKSAFDSIEREAKEATRDVKELERELAKLEAESRAIRASIKVKKGQSLTSEQQQALAIAKKFDTQAASMREAIKATKQTLSAEGGSALRTFAANADKDLLKAAQSADILDSSLADIRNNPGLQSLISPAQMDRLEKLSKGIRTGGEDHAEMLQVRTDRADRVEFEKERKKQQRLSDLKKERLERDASAEKEAAKAESVRNQRRMEEEARVARIARAYRQKGVRGVSRGDRAEIESSFRSQADGRDLSRLRDEIGRSIRPDLFSGSKGLEDEAKRAERAGGIFARSGKLFTSTASEIGKGLKGSSGDVGKFVSALGGLSSAVGSSALRTGIAGLLAALAGGLAALGGAAVLGGIAAISAIAGMDATKIANAAKSVGTSLESFSTLRYAAQVSGVEGPDFEKSLEKLREAMVGSVTIDPETGKSPNGVLWQGGGRLAGMQINSLDENGQLKDTAAVLKEISDIYNKFGTQDLKNAFLDTFSGKENELRALIPLLERGSGEITDLQKEARRLGVELDQKLVDDMKVLNAEVFKLLNVFRGLAYSIGREVLPQLKPVMDAINEFLIGNRDAIASGTVATFNYLIQTIKDFYTLWQTTGQGIVQQDWTKTIYNGVQSVINVLTLLWNAIAAGYEFVKPALTQISDFFGLGGPLEVALLLAGGWVLGFFKVFTSGGKVAASGIALIANAFRGLLVGPLAAVVGAIAGIVGWPVLLGAGVATVAAYWDDIGGLFTKAWDKFKETFPNTAKYLEETFGPALASAKAFTSELVANFEQRFPRLTALLATVRDAVKDAWGWITNLDWSGMFKGLTNAGLGMLDWLASLLDKLSPLLRLIGETIAGIASKAVEYATAAYDVAAPVVGGVIQANGEALQAGAGVVGDWAQKKLDSRDALRADLSDLNMGSFSPLPPPQSAASAPLGQAIPIPVNTGGGVEGGTPIFLQMNEGPTVIAVTQDPAAAQKLSTPMAGASRASITGR
jgi:hypothetical protein